MMFPGSQRRGNAVRFYTIKKGSRVPGKEKTTSKSGVQLVCIVFLIFDAIGWDGAGEYEMARRVFNVAVVSFRRWR